MEQHFWNTSRDGSPLETRMMQTVSANCPAAKCFGYCQQLSHTPTAPLDGPQIGTTFGGQHVFRTCHATIQAGFSMHGNLQRVAWRSCRQNMSHHHIRESSFWHTKPTLTFLSFSFVCGERFVPSFAHAAERQFLQLFHPVMSLPQDSCCQEKMPLTLKQKWHCAIETYH